MKYLTMALEFRIRGYALMRGPVTRDAGATLAQFRCQSFREPLNKSPLARRRLRGMGCAKGDDANATAKGGAVASEGRCDPVAGCAARSSISAVVASPTRVDPASRVPRPALRVATAKGGAVSSEGRCDPAAGCTAQSFISAVAASPTRVDPASRVPRPALRVATALHSLAS